MINEDYNIHD